MIEIQNFNSRINYFDLTLRLPAGNDGSLNVTVVAETFQNYTEKQVLLKNICRTKIFSENYQDFF